MFYRLTCTSSRHWMSCINMTKYLTFRGRSGQSAIVGVVAYSGCVTLMCLLVALGGQCIRLIRLIRLRCL